jgi:hypothetical protein
MSVLLCSEGIDMSWSLTNVPNSDIFWFNYGCLWSHTYSILVITLSYTNISGMNFTDTCLFYTKLKCQYSRLITMSFVSNEIFLFVNSYIIQVLVSNQTLAITERAVLLTARVWIYFTWLYENASIAPLNIYYKCY